MKELQMSPQQKLAAAHKLLADAGIKDAHLSAEGAQDEIAVVELVAPTIDAVAPLAGPLKALGFRYVTIDLLGS